MFIKLWWPSLTFNHLTNGFNQLSSVPLCGRLLALPANINK
jgi:hypothetical protein